jgi:hypothetical protein
MHLIFHIEDQSGAKAMEILIPKMFGSEVTHKIHWYRGSGRLPDGLKPGTDASKRILLDQLPKILRGYSKTPNYGTVVIICDLDNKNKEKFLSELQDLSNLCNPKSKVFFCLAIEEFEAWYLGDLKAVREAYPKAKNKVLNNYKNDEICGTWEVLADAVYPGGSKKLKKEVWNAAGEQKSVWAETISPHMNVDNNRSPSFNEMYAQLKDAVTSATTCSHLSRV